MKFDKINIENRQFDFSILYQGHDVSQNIAPLHYHNYIEFILCLEEGIEFTINTTKIALEEGDILIIGPNVIHSTYKPIKKYGKQYVFRIPPNLLSSVSSNQNYKKSINKFSNLFMPYNYYVVKNEILYSEFMDILKKIYNATLDSNDNTIFVYSQVLMIAHIFLKHKNSIPLKNASVSKGNESNIWKTANFMQEHFNEKITLESMAKMAHMSYSYYPKMFKKIVGVTFSNFLISLRISAAEEMILSGKYSMNEIAERVGIYPQSSFNHAYKKLRGFSPSEFKKR